jgi:hypothetical protein
MTEFKEISVCITKFTELRKQLQVLEQIPNTENCASAEYLILSAWKAFPTCFEVLKRLALALLSFVGSTYLCKQVCSPHCLTDEMSASCATLLSKQLHAS